MFNVSKKILIGCFFGFIVLVSTSDILAAQYKLIAQRNYRMEFSGDSSSEYGNCLYGLRSCPLFCQKLEPFLKQIGLQNIMTSYDKNAFSTDLTNDYTVANLIVWAGHGNQVNNEQCAHFFNLNSTSKWHPYSDHNLNEANACWTEFLLNKNVDYMLMWTCDFLLTGGDAVKLGKIFKMFKGLHIICGYASKMYIHPDQGTSLGDYLVRGFAIKDAWINSSKKYQPYMGSTPIVYAAWACHVEHEYDLLKNTLHTDPPAYSPTTNASSFVRRYYRVN